jgi:hypothetical protein
LQSPKLLAPSTSWRDIKVFESEASPCFLNRYENFFRTL